MSGASKTYRGTIDFKTGAKGANGSEEETVMLLGEDIINKSVPLLLCTEDDVNGAHSTSVGKIDEDKLFYLMAKGLTEQEAKRLLIEASILPILDKIPDDALKENILNAFREMIL